MKNVAVTQDSLSINVDMIGFFKKFS